MKLKKYFDPTELISIGLSSINQPLSYNFCKQGPKFPDLIFNILQGGSANEKYTDYNDYKTNKKEFY